jgi:hypothetical protein
MTSREAKKAAMYSRIYQHAENLNEIFRLGIDGDYAAHIRICKQLRRLEVRAHALQERACNDENYNLTDAEAEMQDRSLLDSLDKIISFRKAGVPVFINGDPRGYALKIDEEYVKKHALKIHRDWGGYGIIAPDLSEE